VVEDRLPKNFKDAMKCDDAEHWKEAINEEINSLISNDVWDVVDRPKFDNIVGTKWVFGEKRDSDGEIERFKARLVAQGFSQIPGVDYTNTYSPVVTTRAWRILLALSAENGWEINHIDVKTAYLNAPIDETVYVEQPEGFVQGDRSFVCKLKKSLYGLHQSAKNWFDILERNLLSLGLKRCVTEPCVYFGEGFDLFLISYVDDLGIFGTKDKVRELKRKLEGLMRVSDKGEMSLFLSYQITRRGDEIKIDQSNFAAKVLKAFGQDNCRGLSTPLPVKLDPSNDLIPFDKTKYRKAIGSLLYMSTGTRPDLAFAVSRQSQFCHVATEENWFEVRHILRYVKQTQNRSITYRKCGKPFEIYTDSDYANDASDRRSHGGYVVILAGGVVSWSSRKQELVASSSTEAEFISMFEASKEAKWMANFLSEIEQHKFVLSPCKILADNQPAIKLAGKIGFSYRTKHFDVKYLSLKGAVRKGKISFEYVATDKNPADMLTKVIPPVKINLFCSMLGMKM